MAEMRAPHDEPRMSGSIVTEHRSLFDERFGAGFVAQALGAIDAEARREFEEARPGGWVRLSTVESVYGALAAALGRTVADLHVEIGRRGIERTLKTVWRMLLRITTDSALITRTPVLFSKSFDRGHLEAKIPTAGYAEITLSAWPDVGEFPLRSLCNGVGTVLRLAGRRDVDVRVAERRADGALLTATWRA